MQDENNVVVPTTPVEPAEVEVQAPEADAPVVPATEVAEEMKEEGVAIESPEQA